MTVRKQEICDIIETLPKGTNQVSESVIVKDENDLREKLQKGIEASEKGKVTSVKEVFDKIEKILVS